MSVMPFPGMAAAAPDFQSIANTGQNALAMFRRGAADMQAENDRNVLKEVGLKASQGDMRGAQGAAFAGGQVKLGMDMASWDIDRRVKALGILQDGATRADTPAKWGALVQMVEQTFGPEMVGNYRDFNSRPKAMTVLQEAQLKMQQAAAARAAADQRREAELHPYKVDVLKAQSDAAKNPNAVYDRRAQAAAAAGLQPGTREYQEFVLTNDFPRAGSPSLSAQIAERTAAAKAMGLSENHPAYLPFTLTGKMPREDQQQETATDKKARWHAEDELPALQSTIDSLTRAKELNKQAYTGLTAGARGAVMTSIPFGMGATDNAKATAEYKQLMESQAVMNMAEILKGATTEKEMEFFVSTIGDLSKPPELRERAIDRLLELARRQQSIKAGRIRELGGKAPDFAKPAPTGQPKPTEIKVINGKTYHKIEDQWYEAGQ
jgi:hypothetical protein